VGDIPVQSRRGLTGTLQSVDIAAVERELCRIPEVRAARVVADDSGQLVEVHILATTGKAAKQLVRDVQSVAITSSGVDIDHRIVSIVQLEEDGTTTPATPAAKADAAKAESSEASSNGHDAPADASAPTSTSSTSSGPANRVIVDSVLVAKHELRAKATVTLKQGDDQAVGVAEGTVASSAR